MNSTEIRHKNAQLLAQRVGGVNNFANRLGKSPSQVSNFTKDDPGKGIGNKIARQIEQAFNKPAGWLDVARDWGELNAEPNRKDEALRQAQLDISESFENIIWGADSIEGLKAFEEFLSSGKKLIEASKQTSAQKREDQG